MHRLTWRRAPACTLHAALAAPDLQFAAVQFLRVHAAFFFLILCTLFLGRERNLCFRGGFLSLPKPLPLFQHCGLAAVFCTRLIFFVGLCGLFFLRCARDLFFFAGLCAVSDSQFCMSPIASEPPVDCQ